MVDAARARVAPFGDRALVRQADATALPFEDAAFDHVVTFIMLHHVIDWEKALAETARVLRPGGTLVGYDLVGDGAGRIMNGREHGTRRMRVGELRDELARLAYTDVTLRPSLGVTLRFRATRGARAET
jgi:ubiquinone/menaquinone biosynthesis C-methylase UbiE